MRKITFLDFITITLPIILAVISLIVIFVLRLSSIENILARIDERTRSINSSIREIERRVYSLRGKTVEVHLKKLDTSVSVEVVDCWEHGTRFKISFDPKFGMENAIKEARRGIPIKGIITGSTHALLTIEETDFDKCSSIVREFLSNFDEKVGRAIEKKEKLEASLEKKE